MPTAAICRLVSRGALVAALGLLFVPGTLFCRSPSNTRVVVVYTSVDRDHAEPILRAFESTTSIRVQAVYDVEATKTVGLANRLIEERGHPRADVFWNGEFTQTMLLRSRGVLGVYRSPGATDHPGAFVSEDGTWTAIAGRARVLLVHREELGGRAKPTRLTDLLDPALPGERVGVALPLFGTTSSHAAALWALWGPERAGSFFERLEAKGVRFVDGNATVRDLVVSGRLIVGLTDSDDACGAVKRGAPVEVVIPDQAEQQDGTLVVIGTVATIQGSPHPAEGRALVDYLAGSEVEKRLLDSGWSHVPMRTHAGAAAASCLGDRPIRSMPVRPNDVFAHLGASRETLRRMLLR